MPSKSTKTSQKPARKQQLAMPHDDEDSEMDEFEAERRQRGMYDDSDEDSEESLERDGEDSEDEDGGSEAESSEMARKRWQGWQADELDGQEEEFTEESGEDDEDSSEDDSEEEAPRRKSKTDQDRLASLRKGKTLCLVSHRLSGLMDRLPPDLEQVPLADLLKAQRKLKAKQAEGSDSEGDSTPAQANGGPNKNRLEAIKRQLLLLQQKKGKALDVAVPRVQEEYDESDGGDEIGDPRDGGEGSRNNLWQVRNERKEDRAREREQEEKRMHEREKRKRDGKHAYVFAHYTLDRQLIHLLSPMVMSAKRPVTRRRQVVELEKTVSAFVVIQQSTPLIRDLCSGTT